MDNLHQRIYESLEAQDAIREREQNYELARVLAIVVGVVCFFAIVFDITINLICK